MAPAFGDRLATVLPTTVVQEPELIDTAPSDTIRQSGAALCAAMVAIGGISCLAAFGRCRGAERDAAKSRRSDAGKGRYRELAGFRWPIARPAADPRRPGARDWMNLPDIKENGTDSVFLAVCILRGKSACPIALAFWSAPEAHHHRLTLYVGFDWIPGLLPRACHPRRRSLTTYTLFRMADGTIRTISRRPVTNATPT